MTRAQRRLHGILWLLLAPLLALLLLWVIIGGQAYPSQGAPAALQEGR